MKRWAFIMVLISKQWFISSPHNAKRLPVLFIQDDFKIYLEYNRYLDLYIYRQLRHKQLFNQGIIDMFISIIPCFNQGRNSVLLDKLRLIQTEKLTLLLSSLSFCNHLSLRRDFPMEFQLECDLLPKRANKYFEFRSTLTYMF